MSVSEYEKRRRAEEEQWKRERAEERAREAAEKRQRARAASALGRDRDRAWAIRCAIAQPPGPQRRELIKAALRDDIVTRYTALFLDTLPRQWGDQEMLLQVGQDHTRHEMIGTGAPGFRGHRATWEGTDVLHEVPPHPDGPEVVGYEWREGEEYRSILRRSLEENHTTTHGRHLDRAAVLANVLALPRQLTRPIGMYGYAFDWPRNPAFYFDMKGTKLEEGNLVRLIEESTGLIHRSIDEAVHLLGDDTFG